MNISGTKPVFCDGFVIGIHITCNVSSQGSSSFNQEASLLLQTAWKSKVSRSPSLCLMRGSVVTLETVTEQNGSGNAPCSSVLAQCWRDSPGASLQRGSFGIKFLINSESPTAASNYHTSISIHVQTDLLLKLQSSC